MTLSSAFARQDRVGRGIGFMLLAWFLFALVDTSVKWLVVLGLPALQLAFMRYFVNLLAAAAFGITQRVPVPRPDRSQALLLVLRAGLLISATSFNFFALKYLSLTVTSAIMFSSPIAVSILSVPLLGERVGPWRWFAILLGFAGVLTVIRPFGESFHWATLLIVYNAFAMALFSIITRKLSGSIPAQTMQLYMGVIGTIVLLPAAVWSWQNPETPRDWALLFLLGLFAWAGHEFFARAHRFADAVVLMPFSYTFIIYLTLTSYLIFGEVPDSYTVLGAAVIILSGLVIWWRENLRPGAPPPGLPR